MKTFGLILKSFRIKQWSKNLLVFAGILFSQNIFDAHKLSLVLIAFAVFCLLSSSAYIFNDLVDIEKDKLHPEKSLRPLASGGLNKNTALFAALFLLITAITASFFTGLSLFAAVLSYALLQVFYSFYLKNVVILDVFAISAGFIIRCIAGAVVINVEISHWLILCTLLLSLFLGFSKRRHEIVLLESLSTGHRKVLEKYKTYMLDIYMAILASATILSYALYTISAETIAKFATKNLIFTTPFVIYGIFRYLYLVHVENKGGSPESILIEDMPTIFNILLWVFVTALIIYIPKS